MPGMPGRNGGNCMKRMLDCAASDFAAGAPRELLGAIAAAEGRTIACETIGPMMPVFGDVTNAEVAAAMGADILLLNLFDVNDPVINALPQVPAGERVRELKRLTGRPIGINLEPTTLNADDESLWAITPGRLATLENGRRAAQMGVDMILLTGNPTTGVSNAAIVDTLRVYRQALGDSLILAAGKMHASGVLEEAGENIVTKEDVEAFARAGADIILLPAPGTVPGITMEYIRGLIVCAHSLGCLAMTAIGTSQEGADTATIRQIALMCKMAGADIHHIGDSGVNGMALPENIQAYSIAVRGIRHTIRRMARSVNR